MRLSQRHLKILETCPRQFEYLYFDRLALTVSPQQQVKSQLGSDFHLLMQQRELGLPIAPILERAPQQQSWMQSILTTAPELFQSEPQAWRESEHVRTLAIDNYLFTVIYDLVILQPERANIIDWKTYPLPKHKKELDRDWQTRLYSYVLAETSDYVPKQIAFTYWFIQSSPQPKSVQIGYTLKQHQQTKSDLSNLLSKLTTWIDAYRTDREPFPQVASSTGVCQRCSFAARCGRESADLAEPNVSEHLTLADIPLVSI
jgi:PD-(D/E)XK nuclease superfamily